MDKLNILESVIFASGDGVTISKLADILNVNNESALILLEELQDKYKNTGINLKRLEDKFQFVSNSDYAEYIQQIVAPKIQKPLSQAAFEVLAIIAYKQPITRAFIEKIRGVESKFSIMKLLERDLIEETGRLDAPGRPVLYGTTELFLQTFGFSSLDDLPALDEFAEKILGEEQYEIENQEEFIQVE